MDFNTLLSALAKEGPLAVVFVVLLLLFYNLTWKVWTRAMDSKDAEIKRLIDQNKQMNQLLNKQHEEVRQLLGITDTTALKRKPKPAELPPS